MPADAKDAKKIFLWVALVLCFLLLLAEGISFGIGISDVPSYNSETAYVDACQSEGFNCSTKDGCENLDPACDVEYAEIEKQFSDPTNADSFKQPGLGIPADALMSFWILIQVILLLVATSPKKGMVPLISGIVNIIASIALIILAIVAIMLAFTKLMVMLGLLAAVPFGPIIYLAIFGFFNVKGAAATLLAALIFKLLIFLFLFLADKNTLRVVLIDLMFIVAIICGIIVSFLHAFVPVMLVSITDSVAAIIVGIIVIIWSVITLIMGGIVQLVGALIGMGKLKPPDHD